jgi:predicted DNA-binding transcriptional regulator AlpA
MVKGKGQLEVLKVARIRPRLLNMRDTAAYCGLAYNTLKNRRSAGTFPVLARIQGGKPYWLIEELDQYIDQLPE